MEMQPFRRKFLGRLGAAGLYATVLATGLLRSARSFAAEWNKAAFDARAVSDALKGIGASAIAESDKIQIKAPEIAENGAIVPVEIVSQLPDTQTIYIIADKNPQPLTAVFDFPGGTEPFVSTRIKMGESSKVRVVVKAGGKFYAATRDVKVTIGGCGG